MNLSCNKNVNIFALEEGMKAIRNIARLIKSLYGGQGDHCGLRLFD